MKFGEIIIPLFLTGLLLYTPQVYAEGEIIIPTPIINIDLQGIINAVNLATSAIGTTVEQSTNAVGSAVMSVPLEIFSLFADAFKGSLTEIDSGLLSLAKTLLSANPDPTPLYSWWQTIVLAISCFYLLIFLITGLMFLFSSISPEKRNNAKEWLKNAFMMIIAVNISFHLYKLLLELATALTQYIWVSGFEGFFEESIFMGTGIILLLLNAGAIALALLTLFTRYVFLLLGVIVFPIGLFLYFIPPLRQWGKMIFNILGIAIFMQFVDVIILVACNHALLQLAGNNAANAFVPALSFTLIAIANTLLIIYALMKAAFSTAENSSILAFSFGAVTGQLARVVAVQPAQQSGSKSK